MIFLFVFLITVISLSLLRLIAVPVGLVDSPGGRKKHIGQIPLVGGIGMFIGFLSLLGLSQNNFEIHWGFLLASFFIVIMGIWDDIEQLPPKRRLLIQAIAATLIVLLDGTILHQLGDLLFLGEIKLGYFALPVTVFAIISVVNAYNMMDGLDGLAGSLSLITILMLLILSFLSGHKQEIWLLIGLASILIAFLLFNFPFPRRKTAALFMGDAGSMFLGLTLAWLCIHLSQNNITIVSPVIFLWIMAIPLFDGSAAIIRRLRRKKSPFAPDQGHLHHILLRKGYNKIQTLFIIVGLAMCCGAFAMVAHYFGVPDGLLFFAWLLLLVIFSRFTRRLQ